MVFRNAPANLFRNLMSFFKGGRGGLVNDLSSQSVVKFGSLIKKRRKLFDVSQTER